MKRLINSSTILALAFYVVPPFAAQAQTFPTVTVDGKAVICLPDKTAVCPDGAFCVVVKNADNCENKAKQAIADAAAKAAGTTAPAATDQTAADKAVADKAAADKAAADKAAADQAAADKAAADKAAADKAAADQAAADKAAKKAAKKAEKAATTTDTTTATTTDTTATATTAAGAAALASVTVAGQVFVCLPDKATACPDGAQCVVAKTPAKCEAGATAKTGGKANGKAKAADTTDVTLPPADAAVVEATKKAEKDAADKAAADPTVKVVDAPVPTDDAVKSLQKTIDQGAKRDKANKVPDLAAAKEAGKPAAGKLPADEAPAKDATVLNAVITDQDNRTSSQEFAAAPVQVAPGKKTGLSDFEKFGLVALGALAVGALINHDHQVIQNTGDRVVVRDRDGRYQVYKDDDTLLRRPGVIIRTEVFGDGSTRTVVRRPDGTQIVTLRDATGRVLRRVYYDRDGHDRVLFDDLIIEIKVNIKILPHPQPIRERITIDQDFDHWRAAIAASDAAHLGRSFSLNQIRTIPEVRVLAPSVDLNDITFDSGSAAISADQAGKLEKLGGMLNQLIKNNPGEMFLVEGHTDAVGSAAANLALSDQRAESVAKALTEDFAVPPENLVVQGYGESELRVDTFGPEPANRWVAVRIITPLLHAGQI